MWLVTPILHSRDRKFPSSQKVLLDNTAALSPYWRFSTNSLKTSLGPSGPMTESSCTAPKTGALYYTIPAWRGAPVFYLWPHPNLSWTCGKDLDQKRHQIVDIRNNIIVFGNSLAPMKHASQVATEINVNYPRFCFTQKTKRTWLRSK